MNKRTVPAPVLLLLVLACAPVARAQEPLRDPNGRLIGYMWPGDAGLPPGGRVAFLPPGEAFAGGRVIRFPAGQYLIGGAGPIPPPLPAGPQEPGLVNLFKDGTLEYLPLKEWDLGDIATGDLNGDGREDIVFSIARYDCDSIPGTVPRVWIQNQAGRFVDETATRIPPVTTSTRDIDLFDADGDGDADILLGGYDCDAEFSPGTLLINDGGGVFTDETAERLIGVPEFTFLSYADEAPLDSGGSADIVAVLGETQLGATYPYLFLNTGDGHFWPDRFGRLLVYGNHDFNDLSATDFTGDGHPDLLFMNGSNPDTGKAGGLALFRNAGDGFFVDETATRLGPDTHRTTRSVALADADGDGDTDILDVGWFSSNNDPQVRLLLNDGSGAFGPAAGGVLDTLTGWFNAAALAPFYGDSLPDLFLAKIVVTSYSEDVFLLNGGGGAFRDSSELLPSVIDYSVALGVFDYQHDGDPDIAVGNSNPVVDWSGQNRLYINQRLSPPVAVEEGSGLPAAAELAGNYPNPFNPSTAIRFSLPERADVTVTVSNVLGEEVFRADLGPRAPGVQEFRWDAGGLSGGVYWYALVVDGRRIGARPALLLK